MGGGAVDRRRGAWRQPADLPGAGPGCGRGMRGRWSPGPNVRRDVADDPVGADGSEIAPLMFNGVGGGTILYNDDRCRMRPSAFRVRTPDGLADAWPIHYADLGPGVGR